MRFVCYLQHWLRGTGARLQVTDFVPCHASHPAMGGYVSLGGAGQRHRAQFRHSAALKAPGVADGPCPSASC